MTKQAEMESYYKELMSTILAEGKKGLVPKLAPKFVSCSHNESSLTLNLKWRIG